MLASGAMPVHTNSAIDAVSIVAALLTVTAELVVVVISLWLALLVAGATERGAEVAAALNA